MKLNSVFVRTMAVEYEGTRQRLLECLEKMTAATPFAGAFMQLADEHNRMFADLVEVFYGFENSPGLPQSFEGAAIYEKFVEAMKRLSVMMKPQNLEALLKTLHSIRHVYAFALHFEQTTSKLYGEMAASFENGPIRSRLDRLAAMFTEAAKSLEERVNAAPTDQVTIEITPLPPEEDEDDKTPLGDILVN